MADVAGVNSRRSRYFPTNGDADSDESVYTVDDEEYFSSSEELEQSDRRREPDRTGPSRAGSDDVVINDRDISFRRSSENLNDWRPSPRTEVELLHQWLEQLLGWIASTQAVVIISKSNVDERRNPSLIRTELMRDGDDHEPANGVRR